MRVWERWTQVRRMDSAEGWAFRTGAQPGRAVAAPPRCRAPGQPPLIAERGRPTRPSGWPRWRPCAGPSASLPDRPACGRRRPLLPRLRRRRHGGPAGLRAGHREGGDPPGPGQPAGVGTHRRPSRGGGGMTRLEELLERAAEPQPLVRLGHHRRPGAHAPPRRRSIVAIAGVALVLGVTAVAVTRDDRQTVTYGGRGRAPAGGALDGGRVRPDAIERLDEQLDGSTPRSSGSARSSTRRRTVTGGSRPAGAHPPHPEAGQPPDRQRPLVRRVPRPPGRRDRSAGSTAATTSRATGRCEGDRLTVTQLIGSRTRVRPAPTPGSR